MHMKLDGKTKINKICGRQALIIKKNMKIYRFN